MVTFNIAVGLAALLFSSNALAISTMQEVGCLNTDASTFCILADQDKNLFPPGQPPLAVSMHVDIGVQYSSTILDTHCRLH